MKRKNYIVPLTEITNVVSCVIMAGSGKTEDKDEHGTIGGGDNKPGDGNGDGLAPSNPFLGGGYSAWDDEL